MFLSNPKINFLVKSLISNSITESKQAVIETQIELNKPKIVNIIRRSIANQPIINYNILMFGLLMLEELILHTDARNARV